MSHTGRVSGASPALQNIPIRAPEGRRIRDAFRPPGTFVIDVTRDPYVVEAELARPPDIESIDALFARIFFSAPGAR